MTNRHTPTLFEWIGGEPALKLLTSAFYGRVKNDSLLAPVFANASAEHAEHVAAFIGEVFSGPDTYSSHLGGHAGMIMHHMNRSLTEPQRRRWINLLLDTYQDLSLPDDPEFMSALASYLEWGSRLAVLNSRHGTIAPLESLMPVWGWGEVGGPYNPEQKQ
jgi:hemoglobin